MHKIIIPLIFVSTLCLFSCKKHKENTIKTDKNYSLDSYWNQGKAEVNVYELSQNRYNNLHNGSLVSVFVKEDFLTEKQVKNEQYKNPKSTEILKNIQLRKFTTGVYDYALFTSTFTPVDKKSFPKTLKVSASSQEWCGTIYTQFNYRNNQYETQQFSYFEKEGDTNGVVVEGILEDELFNTIRMNPELLPQGSFKLIPAANFIQLKHLPRKAFDANAVLKNYSDNEFEEKDLLVYEVTIEALSRTLQIVFKSKAPYKIQGWLDSFPSAFDQKIRTTKVVLKKRKLLPYWALNNLEDENLRNELGL